MVVRMPQRYSACDQEGNVDRSRGGFNINVTTDISITNNITYLSLIVRALLLSNALLFCLRSLSYQERDTVGAMLCLIIAYAQFYYSHPCLEQNILA